MKIYNAFIIFCFFCLAQSAIADQAPVLQFPRDEGTHAVPVEWYYFSGHLTDEQGLRYGFMVTYFLTYGHGFGVNVSVNDPQTQEHFFERRFMNPLSVRGHENEINVVANDKDSVITLAPFMYQLKSYAGDSVQLNLNLVSLLNKPVIHDGVGYFTAAGIVNYYYSQPQIHAEGELQIHGKKLHVSGISWMDHQWGQLQKSATRVAETHWLSAQFPDGRSFNFFQILAKDEKTVVGHFGKVIDPAGTEHKLNDFTMTATQNFLSNHTGKSYGVDWQVTIPELNETLLFKPDQPDQELYAKSFGDFFSAFWEGRGTVLSRKANGEESQGLSYIETLKNH